MIPDFGLSTMKLFGLVPVQPFGLMISIGLILGYFAGCHRAKRIGIDVRICANGGLWGIFGGFIFSHWVELFFYHPERVVENPLVIFVLTDGMSSFGGFFGAGLFGYIYYRKHNASLLDNAEAIVFSVVPGWIIARGGCFLVFDHPGQPTDFFLAQMHPSGVVLHNLGLYEMIFTIGLAVFLFFTRNWRPFHGFHMTIVFLLYGPVRFLMDYLRVADVVYWGLTPGQYFSAVMTLAGIAFLRRGLKRRAQGDIPAQPPVLPAAMAEAEALRNAVDADPKDT
jgi:phosphatidylglycerol---prolipoprotein diacylglyceryl transferase